jgi:hypothetical protein
MSVIEGLSKIVAETAGALLFKEITLQRITNASDGRGGFTTSKETFQAKGVLSEYSDYIRQVSGIPEDARLLVIQGYQIPYAPRVEDLVAIEGESWRIIRIEAAPGNAVYECEVHPDRGEWAIDLQTTITEDPAILAGLSDIVASAGSVMFQELTYYRISETALDARGSHGRLKVAVTVKGIVTELTDVMRQIGGISEDERQVIIQSKDLGFVPMPGEVIGFDGKFYQVKRVDSVPGAPIYQFQAAPIEASAVNLEPITATLAITLDPITVFRAEFAASVGVSLSAEGINPLSANMTSILDQLISLAASGDVIAEGSATNTLGAITLNAQGGTTEIASLSQTLAPITSSASGELAIEASASILLDPLTALGEDAEGITGDAAGVIGPFSLNADASLSIGGGFTGTLSLLVSGQSELQIQGEAALGISVDVNAQGVSPIEGTTTGEIGPFTLSGSAENTIEANLASSLVGITSGGDGAQSGGSNEPETDALIAEMAVAPTSARETAINDLIAAMKTAGVWDLLGWFSIVGHDTDASLKNWIVPTEDLTVNNGASVVADQYFDSKSNPSGNGGFTAGTFDDGGAALANVTFGVYFVKLDELGQTRASRLRDNQTYFRCDFSSPILKLSGGAQFPNTYATYDINGLYHITGVHRGTGAADREAYYNGVSYSTKDGAGGTLSNTVDLLGTAAKNSDERYFCGYYGQALTSQQVADLHTAIEAYKAAL